MGRKAVANLVFAVLVVCVLIIIFLANFAFLLSSNSYVQSKAMSLSILDNARPMVEPSLAPAIISDVAGYVRGSRDSMAYANLFTNEEVFHLADVRKRIRLAFLSLYAACAAAAVSLLALYFISGSLQRFAFALSKVLFASGIASFAVVAAFFLLSFNFDLAFVAFHKAIFGSSQWQFPSDYLVVSLFTEDFFAVFAKDVAVGAMINGILLLVVGSAISVFTRFVAFKGRCEMRS